ncbi:MAG: hypothetical protein QOD81_1138 [Solirubrobacteraceae bacterium]|jgi:hypothetical protein|nr:hypothetical protein [Solirubrobacteraceae bacterium]
MAWKRSLNRALARATRFELRRVGARRPRAPLPGDRLLKAPVFVLCTVRSGSTLLRVLLNSHSQIHAPQELHLRDLDVAVTSPYAEQALAEIGLDAAQLDYLLWDRLLHRELAQSGKRLLVNKTPTDVFIADRIRECWPDARFIFLLRHPAAVAVSRQGLRPQDSPEQNAAMVRLYGDALQAARQAHPGLTVRYEDLAADPRPVTQEVCRFLGVRWEPEMLEYGRQDHGRYRAGLGDWKDKIRSGSVQPPEPAPAEIPPALVELCEAWGYAPAGAPAGAGTPAGAATG